MNIMPHCIDGQNITYDFCDFMQYFEPILTTILLQLMFIPLLTIIVITLIDQENSDAKWFVFNTAVLNFILGILWEMIRFSPINPYIVIQMWGFIRDLAPFSIFPLALTRFFYLYSPELYKKIFSKKTLFCWIIGYDVILILLIYTYYYFEKTLSLFIINFVILIGTFSCSFFVLLKIRQMMKLVSHNTELSTLDDLRRAAFLCVFQACFYTIYMISILYYRFYYLLLNNGEQDLLYLLLRVINTLGNPIYLSFVILDSLVPMILLKSYRKTLRKVFSFVLRVIWKKQNSVGTVTINIIPSENPRRFTHSQIEIKSHQI